MAEQAISPPACAPSGRESPRTVVEALTPDFQGVTADVETVVDSGIAVFAQNVETVERLTHPVRDPRAGYRQTLDVLEHAKRYRPAVLTKTSLMLGLGETADELYSTMDDLRAIGCDLLTLGQYLRPTENHLPIARFVTPGGVRAVSRGRDFARISRVCFGPAWCARAIGPNVRSRAATAESRQAARASGNRAFHAPVST